MMEFLEVEQRWGFEGLYHFERDGFMSSKKKMLYLRVLEIKRRKGGAYLVGLK